MVGNCAGSNRYLRLRRLRKQINSTGTTPNNYLYRGEQFDRDLGLYYLRARYYNPLSGRFMSVAIRKTVIHRNPQSLHKYLYAGGDPVNATDPTGKAELFETGLVLDEDAAITAASVRKYALAIAAAECYLADKLA